MNSYKTLIRMPLEKVTDIAASAGILVPPIPVSDRHKAKKFLARQLLTKNCKDEYGAWVTWG